MRCLLFFSASGGCSGEAFAMADNPLPVIKLWGNLLVPLQGEITDRLAERISVEVLNLVYDSGVRNVIIDITGLWLLDSHICSMLATLGASARLMGAQAVICGMSAEIAQTLQMMDIGLENLRSALSVEEAFELLGIRVSVPNSDGGEDDAEEPIEPGPAAGARLMSTNRQSWKATSFDDE
jgi:rsbT antagonist protein RsbS